jgi:hypothetical protein
MAAEEQEIDWIYFEIDGYKLRIDPDNTNNLQTWRDTWNGRAIKNPYWRKVAVCIGKAGYYQCHIGNRNYMIHRIVYFAHNPEWNIHDGSAKNKIDHEDGNPMNNHISNLRVVTQAQNCQNKIAKGYWFDNSKKTCKKKWRSFIVVNGKRMHLGRFLTEEEAKQARAEAVMKYHPFARQS